MAIATELLETITDYVRAEIIQASRDEDNWTWDESESSCGGADITNPTAEAGSMWCGLLTVPSLELEINYGFCVRWNGRSAVDIDYDSGCRDGDLGDIDHDDDVLALIDMEDLCWEVGSDLSTPGLENAILAVTGRGYIVEHSYDGWIVVSPDRSEATDTYLDSEEAKEACRRLNDGTDEAAEYEWHDWEKSDTIG